jgi:hypothetical protein
MIVTNRLLPRWLGLDTSDEVFVIDEVVEERVPGLGGDAGCAEHVGQFFKTIKSELIWPVAWQSRQQAENAVARYIDGFYNPVRRQSSLGFQSPIAFERKAREVS